MAYVFNKFSKNEMYTNPSDRYGVCTFLVLVLAS